MSTTARASPRSPIAASNCNLESVKFFLSKGANVNTANTEGGQVKFGKIQLIKLTPADAGFHLLLRRNWSRRCSMPAPR